MSDTTIMISDERPILMKSGLVHWVKIKTWEKISNVLADQQGHQFISIAELGGIVINSAQIEGAYTIDQYQDHCRVKEGQWQCAYRVWHPKKGECQCKQDFYRKQREEEAKRKEAEDNKPLTPEEQERNRDAFRRMSEKAALDGQPGNIFRTSYSIGNKSGKSIRRSTIKEWEKEKGRTADLSGLAINENE